MEGFVPLKNKIWVLAALLLASFQAQARCDFDDFPTMSEMKFFPLMGDAVFNNRPMMVKGYTADVTMNAVVNHYQREWKDQYDNSTFAHWYQVSTLTDDCMMTVQIAKQNQGVHGRLVISNVPQGEAKAELGEGLLYPPDSVVVSDLVTRDGPKKGRVSVIAAGGSSSEVTTYYLSQMDRAGWVLEHSFNQDQAQVLVFRKGANISNILIIPAPGLTQVLINEEVVD